MLSSNSTIAQVASGSNLISSFNSNGFSLGGWANAGSAPFASWTFRKQPKFFDVVTYTGNGFSSQFVPHNLQSSYGFAVIKRTDSTTSTSKTVWRVRVVPGTSALVADEDSSPSLHVEA